MSIGIYKITSPTNKIYIGQSTNIEVRFLQHKSSAKKLQLKKLYNSFLKHGVNAHTFEIIEICDIEILDMRERYWQIYYNSVLLGLNCHLTNVTGEKTHIKIIKRKEKIKKNKELKEKVKKEREFNKSQMKIVINIINSVL